MGGTADYPSCSGVVEERTGIQLNRDRSALVLTVCVCVCVCVKGETSFRNRLDLP